MRNEQNCGTNHFQCIIDLYFVTITTLYSYIFMTDKMHSETAPNSGYSIEMSEEWLYLGWILSDLLHRGEWISISHIPEQCITLFTRAAWDLHMMREWIYWISYYNELLILIHRILMYFISVQRCKTRSTLDIIIPLTLFYLYVKSRCTVYLLSSDISVSNVIFNAWLGHVFSNFTKITDFVVTHFILQAPDNAVVDLQ